MREITKKDIEGLWLIKPLHNCEIDEDINFNFRNNKLSINGTNIYNANYEIINIEGTKILKIEENDSFLEIWMIMDENINSLIVNYNERRFYIEKRFNIISKI
jgi:hypothetical protein